VLLRRPAAALEPSASWLPFACSVVGAVALIVAELLTLREIRTITVVPPGGTTTGGSHHLGALALLGVAMLPMAFGAAVRGARPAAVALVVLSAAAAAIVLLVDLPTLNDTGLIGRTYDLAEARPGPGFYVESAGAALALVGAVGLLVLSPPRPGRRRPPPSRSPVGTPRPSVTWWRA
jgi:hypothetical protein